MNVLIFSTAYLPCIGGAEIAVKEITDRLPDVQFSLITAKLVPDLPDQERMGNVTVYRIGKGNWFDKIRLIFSGVKKAHSLGRFDVVWSIMASYSGFAALQYKKKNPSVRFLLTLQEGDSFAHIYSRVWFVWPWFKQIFTKADQIQAISQYLAMWGKRMGAPCPITVVPNGITFEIFEDTNPQKQTSNDIITISRLVPKNGVFLLVQAMEYLPDHTQLTVIGSGPEEGKITSYIHEKKLEQRVHLLGAIANAELPPYLHAADVFCRPSLSEGLGISFLEAMAAGVPIVAPNVGGISDFLKDGETGLFCTHDPKDIAEKIKMIMDDQTLAGKLRTNAQRLMKETYSWDVIAPKIQALFTRV